MIIVADKNKFNLENLTNPLVYYVGRPSWFGNPHIIGVHGTRSQVIEMYRETFENWMLNSAVKRAELFRLAAYCQDGNDLVLQCHCHPLSCHADIIKEYIEHILKVCEGK